MARTHADPPMFPGTPSVNQTIVREHGAQNRIDPCALPAVTQTSAQRAESAISRNRKEGAD